MTNQTSKTQTFTRKQMLEIVDGDLVNFDNHVGGGKQQFRPMIAHQDGTFSFRETFFYRHGKTTADWRKQVVEFFDGRGMTVEVVDQSEEWKQWPADSYWSVTVRFIEIEDEDEDDEPEIEPAADLENPFLLMDGFAYEAFSLHLPDGATPAYVMEQRYGARVVKTLLRQIEGDFAPTYIHLMQHDSPDAYYPKFAVVFTGTTTMAGAVFVGVRVVGGRTWMQVFQSLADHHLGIKGLRFPYTPFRWTRQGIGARKTDALQAGERRADAQRRYDKLAADRRFASERRSTR